MCFKVMLFDLDETLYPPATGIWEAIGLRMDRFIEDYMHISKIEVTSLRNELFHKYGTTLRGLREVYGINETEFLAYVHDIPINNYLRKDEGLIHTLSLFSPKKVIFTNADTNHAKRVLTCLGVENFFEKVIDIKAIHPYCKPMTEAFEEVLRLLEKPNPGDCVVIDDSLRNLQTAHEQGFYTIRVGSTDRHDFTDASILTIHDLPEVIPVG